MSRYVMCLVEDGFLRIIGEFLMDEHAPAQMLCRGWRKTSNRQKPTSRKRKIGNK